MSNRKTGVSKDQDQRHKKLLSEQLKKEENRYCADCPTRGPTWASVNLGCFICLQCSGIHRSLGVHISQVRSTTLDTWLPEQVTFMRCMGNKVTNKFWEKNLPADFRKPREDSHELAKYIRDKYIDKRYCDREVEPPSISNYKSHPYVQEQLRSIQGPVHATPPSPAANMRAPQAITVSRSSGPAGTTHKTSTPVAPVATFDLLGMDDPAPASEHPSSIPGDGTEWASFQEAPPTKHSPPPQTNPSPGQESPSGWTAFEAAVAAPVSPLAAKSPAPVDLFAGVSAPVSVAEPRPQTPPAVNQEKQRASAADILKLYDAPSNQGLGGALPLNLGIPMGNSPKVTPNAGVQGSVGMGMGMGVGVAPGYNQGGQMGYGMNSMLPGASYPYMQQQQQQQMMTPQPSVQGMMNPMGGGPSMGQKSQLYPQVMPPEVVMPSGMGPRPAMQPMNGMGPRPVMQTMNMMSQGNQFSQLSSQPQGKQLFGSAQVSEGNNWGL